MKSIYLYVLLLISILLACNSDSPKQEKVLSQSYTSKEIGWTIVIPAGYKLTSQVKMNADDKKGKEAIGKVYDGEIKSDSLKHLVSFMKNQFNAFNSTIEPYTESEEGEYAANNQLIKKLLFDTYHKQGIKIDTSSAKIKVKNQDFNAFYIKIYGPNGDVVLNQIMFNRMVNGYDFGVNINYNNEDDKNMLMNAFMSSNFTNN